ncbi:MAG: OmpA family protein [Bacteroidota bacterium]|nr:OmpA family protein [Bacteroidota bacterium]
MKKIVVLSIITLGLVLSGCIVSKKKFDALSKKKTLLEADFAECQDSLNNARNKAKLNKDQINALNNSVKKLKSDSTSLNDKLVVALKQFEDQSNISDRLRKDYKDLLASYSAESNKLTSNLAKKEQQLIDLEKSLQDTKAQNDKLAADLKERERKVKELESVLRKKDSAVVAIKNKVTNALLAFDDKDLTVKVKNGKVYVSLSEQLLFKSGSTSVDKKGEDALKKLAGVLKSQDDINVMIEGHTDDVPVSKGSAAFSDNWDLSVLRATEIARILIKEGADPKKVIPSGRSQYSPVAEGKTSEARQKNRRTEIILSPKLDELFKMLEAN